jgi:nitroreductase
MLQSAVEDINQIFRLRYSGRAYDPAREVSSLDLTAVFEAARWSPSGGNMQPWRYIYARREDTKNYDKLFDLLSNGNKEWAQNAPVLILSGALTVRLNSQGEKQHHPLALHDLGLANMSISLEAAHRGLMAHMIGGFDKDSAHAFLPEDIEPAVMITLGYPGDHSILSEFNQGRETAPRTRKPLEEIISTL